MIIIINGKPRAGKDTVVKFFKEISQKQVFNRSTVDLPKGVLDKITKGKWGKTDKDRNFLSDMADLLWEYNKYQRRYIFKAYAKVRLFDSIVFYHCREPEIIRDIVKQAEKRKIPIKTLFIESNRSIESSAGGDSKVNEPYDYDYIMYNKGTLKELKKEVNDFNNWL